MFGLGGILCEILTGVPPYIPADGDLVQQAARGELEPAMERLDGCGANPVMIALCKQCLSPTRRARPESAKEVADRVGAYLSSVEERARQAEIDAAKAKLKARSTVIASVAAVAVLAMGGGGYLWAEAESAKHRANDEQLVTDAMQEVHANLRVADTTQNPDQWRDVETAAERLEQVLGSDYLGDSLRERAEAQLRIVAGRQRNEDMRERLLAVRIPADDDVRAEGWEQSNAERMDSEFSAAFADYLDGRKIEDLSTGAAGDELAESPIAIELAAALDLWALTRRGNGQVDDVTEKLERLARRLDADSDWRNDLRDLIPHGEDKRAELEALAESADLRALPELSIVLLAEALWSVGAREDAMDVIQRGRLLHPDDFSLCFRLALMKKTSEAWATELVTEYSTAAALRPGMSEVWHRLGCSMGCAGRHGDAEELFRMLVEREPDYAHWHQHVANSLSNQQRYDEAMEVLREALEQHPDDGALHVALGVAYLRQDQLDRALECYERGIELGADPGTAHANCAFLLDRQGQSELAVERYRTALEHSPKHVNARRNLSGILRRLQRMDEALENHLEWREIDPDRLIIHVELGDIFFSMSRLQDAQESFHRARTIVAKVDDPTQPQWKQDWMGRLNRAIQNVERALQARPRLLAIARGEIEERRAIPLANAAEAAYQEKEFLAARRTFERAFAASTGQVRTTYGFMYSAACCAILAAFGHGTDSASLSADQRDQLRDQAYDYFTTQLKLESERIDQRSTRVPDGERRLLSWQRDTDLTDVRDANKIAALPDEEAARWRELWDGVADALERAEDVAKAIRWLTAAESTYDRGDYVVASRAYTKALTAHPYMRDVRFYRYNLACSLALAAAGKGKGAADLTAERRTEMRAEAHAHLEEDLAHYETRLEEASDRGDLIRDLKHWLVDGDFADVRGEALDALPDDEAQPWHDLWEAVELTLEAWGG